MKILFCCEFYAPSVGGVQEVMRQIAQRLVDYGHEITVATSKLSERTFTELAGVKIQEFDVAGNAVRGIVGEQERYRDFVIKGNFDVVMIKAAQQWTFDALWPVLDQIDIPKVFIPCGFSGLYEPGYAEYFRQMPDVLNKFDHLIFYASEYRDIDFAKQHGISHFSILPNGASEVEFNAPQETDFRARHGIPEDAFLFLTVGSLTGLKGHQELAEAFALMKLPDGKKATLILNGNECLRVKNDLLSLPGRLIGLVKAYGLVYACKHTLKQILWRMGLRVGNRNGYKEIATAINQERGGKQIVLSDYPRQELIQAYMAADLFVFASNVEYSPLVLFETAAAGTPFLSVDVGNAKEIARWTEAGVMCPSWKDDKGYTRVAPEVMASKMSDLMADPELLKNMGARGRRNWSERFTWQKISRQYEDIFENLVKETS